VTARGFRSFAARFRGGERKRGGSTPRDSERGGKGEKRTLTVAVYFHIYRVADGEEVKRRSGKERKEVRVGHFSSAPIASGGENSRTAA